MNLRELEGIIPLIGTTIGGFVGGVVVSQWNTDWTGGTFLAGFLGFAGGYLAYRAATTQQRAIEERNAFSFGVRTNERRKEIATGIQHVLRPSNEGNFYAAVGIFLANTVPELEKVLAGSDPLPHDLAKLVAKTSHELITIVAIVETLLDARRKRSRNPSVVYDEQDETRRLKVKFTNLISCLHAMDTYFRFPHEHILGSSS